MKLTLGFKLKLLLLSPASLVVFILLLELFMLSFLICFSRPFNSALAAESSASKVNLFGTGTPLGSSRNWLKRSGSSFLGTENWR
jgi:hypothetical protein